MKETQRAAFMTTPIDYGKEFLENYWHNRDAAATLTYLADDVVWITPDEIRHLRSRKEILQFMQDEIDKDPRKFNVDIASIRSAPTSDQSSTIVYEINLIPQHTERSMNLRCSLAITRKGEECELTFIGMSRKYKRSNAEQIRGFIESLPSGVLVLTSLAGGDFRALYGNTYFAKRLGYDEDAFYDRIDENPFFMMPYEQQRQMIGFAQELAALKRPKPLAFKVALETQKGKTLPFQAILTAAYKDGSRTIYYMLFNDLSAIEQETERQHKKDIKAAVEQQKTADLALLDKTADKAQRAMDALQRQIDTLQQEAQEAKEELAATKEAAEAKAAELQTTIDELRQSAEMAQAQHDKLIEALRVEAADKETAHKQELLQQQADLESKARSEVAAAKEAAQQDHDEMTAQLEACKREAAAERKALEQQIAGLQATIRDQQLGMASQETSRQTLRKEQTKSAARVETLIRGQMSRMASLLEVLPKEENKAQAAENVRRASEAAAEIPDMAHELLAIAAMDPTSREELVQEEFALAAGLETIRRVMLPQCRERGVIFAIESGKRVPSRVRTSRAGLQMVLLSILENALASTTRGGRITLTVKSNPPIRNKAYCHFVITDTGSGIDENQMRTLFDDGDGELAVTRKVISRMGGNVNVTTEAGAGSRFDVGLTLEIVAETADKN